MFVQLLHLVPRQLQLRHLVWTRHGAGEGASAAPSLACGSTLSQRPAATSALKASTLSTVLSDTYEVLWSTATHTTQEQET